MPVFVMPSSPLGSTSRKRPGYTGVDQAAVRLTIPISLFPRLPELFVSP